MSTGCAESPAPGVHVLVMSNLLGEDTRACSLELDEDDVTLKTSN